MSSSVVASFDRVSPKTEHDLFSSRLFPYRLEIDKDPLIGGLVDTTANFENEQADMMKVGVDLTPELWLVKLLLGPIDSSYDSKDE